MATLPKLTPKQRISEVPTPIVGPCPREGHTELTKDNARGTLSSNLSIISSKVCSSGFEELRARFLTLLMLPGMLRNSSVGCCGSRCRRNRFLGTDSCHVVLSTACTTTTPRTTNDHTQPKAKHKHATQCLFAYLCGGGGPNIATDFRFGEGSAGAHPLPQLRRRSVALKFIEGAPNLDARPPAILGMCSGVMRVCSCLPKLLSCVLRAPNVVRPSAAAHGDRHERPWRTAPLRARGGEHFKCLSPTRRSAGAWRSRPSERPTCPEFSLWTRRACFFGGNEIFPGLTNFNFGVLTQSSGNLVLGLHIDIDTDAYV